MGGGFTKVKNMIGFCSIQNIRDRNAAFTVANIIDAIITTQIENAENTILADLSGMFTEADLTAAVGSSVLQELATYKAIESCLVYTYGHTRETDKVTDVDYWGGKYDELLKQILNGSVIIEVGGTDYTPTNTPKITANVTEIFDTRGIEGFDPEYDSNENNIIVGTN